MIWDQGLLEGRNCGCDSPFAACPFWTAVGQEAFGGWSRVDAGRAKALRGRLLFRRLPIPHPFALPFILHPGMSSGFRRSLEEYGALMRRLYQGIAAVSGAEVIVDSMKVPGHVFAMSRLAGVDARLLHLVRDPRGVAFSNVKEVKREGVRSESYRVRRRPAKSALRWLWINQAFRVLAHGGMPTTILRYESFVAAPGVEVRRIAAGNGVALGEEDLAFVRGDEIDLPEDHLVAGNRLRFQTGVLRLRSDEEWRQGLDPLQRRTVEALTAPLRSAYGYRSGSSRDVGNA